ncbi:syndecan-3-like [Pristis pectinata]|uniref:syndecan-3-like n=1 Tax=Pristis pectinata TaxID=685728 RepID=UPI00223D4A4C|nr:syndecan-3-like [Pristis pectinata]
MSNFSLAFLLTTVFPTVLLAVSPTERPNELEASGSYSENDDDDFYSGSGSGSGDGFVLQKSYSTAEYTKAYHTVPSTASSSPHYSSQIPVTEISSQDVTKDLSTVLVHPDLLLFNTTTVAIVTSPMSSSTISKDFDELVPEFRKNNFMPRGANNNYDTTVPATQMSSASSNIPTTISDHRAAIINEESFTVSSVIAEKEIMTTVVTEANQTQEDVVITDVDMVDMNSPNALDDIFISEDVERVFAQTQNSIQDHQSSAKPPSGSYSRDYSTSGSFLERRELLAAAVAGGFVGLMIAVLLVVVLVYRMKKKDEGSYSLDESKQPNGGYQKPQKQEEFYA